MKHTAHDTRHNTYSLAQFAFVLCIFFMCQHYVWPNAVLRASQFIFGFHWKRLHFTIHTAKIRRASLFPSLEMKSQLFAQHSPTIGKKCRAFSFVYSARAALNSIFFFCFFFHIFAVRGAYRKINESIIIINNKKRVKINKSERRHTIHNAYTHTHTRTNIQFGSSNLFSIRIYHNYT